MIFNSIYANSKEFIDMINIIGVPRYNVFGEELNEQIYNNYQEFVYGAPERITQRQRWKNVYNGKWIRNGIKGEYFILGRDYNGNLSYNFFFPVDRVPTETPDRWNYCEFSGASASWQDKNKFIYSEQIDHMLNSNILFDKIDFENNTTDPHTLVEYNITPRSIGTNKCMLDVASTWKTYGSIVTKRKINGIWWTAVFRIKPMSANATIENFIKVDKEKYIIDSEEDNVKIKINTGTEVKNLTGYAKAKHIKNINTKIIVNGKEIESFSTKQNLINSKEVIVTLNRVDLKEGLNKIKIVNESYLETAFSIDGLLKDITFKEIIIDVKKQKPKDPLQNIDTQKLIKKDDYCVESPYKYIDVPMFQAGQYMISKLIFSDKIDKLETTDETTIKKVKDNIYLIVKKIPLNEESTISSVKEARENVGNYFDIKDKNLNEKLKNSKSLNITYNYKGFEYKNKIEYEICGDIINNFNFQSKYDDIERQNILISEWINNE